MLQASTIINLRAVTLLLYIVHHEIRRPDGIIVIHREFVVIQASTDFSQDLYPHQCPAGGLSNNTHGIIASRWLGQGGAVNRHFVSPPDNHSVQQHRLPIGIRSASAVRR